MMSVKDFVSGQSVELNLWLLYCSAIDEIGWQLMLMKFLVVRERLCAVWVSLGRDDLWLLLIRMLIRD